MNTNISPLQPQSPPQVQRLSKDGQDKDASFLALRLLNKRARVRLSANSIKLDSIPGRGVLFAVANSTGSFAAITCDATGGTALIVSSLSELRAAFTSSTTEDEILFAPRRTISLPGPAVALTFAAGDSRLLVAFTEGSTAVYEAQSLLGPGSNSATPLTVFQSPTGAAPHELANNPGDIPNLVAVLYGAGTSQGAVVQLFDVQELRAVGGWASNGTPATTPTSLSWSTKGKQLAIGLQSGDIITFSPNDTSSVKNYIPAPASVQSQSLIGLTWLSNSDFHCIYAPPGPLMPESDQTHMIIVFDPKAKAETDVKLNTPYFTVPSTRPPGSFNAVLRHWEPTKFMVFAGDSTTSDIGLIGCMIEAGEEVWCNFSMEENSTPSLPLDKDMNDTILLGLAIDVTGTENHDFTTVSGEITSLPAPPIMLAYVSDGTILGWNIINIHGRQYPGMISPASATDAAAAMDTSIVEDKPSIVVSTIPTAFGQASSAVPSTFGQTSAFGQSGFGQTAALGGAASGFGSKAPVSGGFGAFASSSSKFGQTGFGLTAPSAVADNASLASPMAISMSNSEEPMSADIETNTGFGGLSLGRESSSEADKPTTGSGAGGLFGAFATSDATKPTSAFGSGGNAGLVKPATGFGAFANSGPSSFGALGATSSPTSGDSKPSAFPATNSTPSSDGGNSLIKPASGFGAFANSSSSTFSTNTTSNESKPSAFGGTGSTTTTHVSPAFGQSGFGNKPAFGQSSFGQPAFGQSAFGQSSFGSGQAKSAFGESPAASSGGFASFAKTGPTGFSAFAKPAESEQKPSPASETTSSTGVEAEMSAPEAPKTEAEKRPVSGNAANETPSTPATKVSSAFETPSTPTLKSETSTTPATSPSVFKSSSPGPTTGAFANLTAHPTGFGKVDSGFGAFGNATPSSSSPFLNPPKLAATGGAFSGSGSAFASVGSSSSAKPSQPAFGATSSLGSGSSASTTAKPAFGVASTVGSSSKQTSAFGQSAFGSSIKPATTTSGGFSAFASSGGFSAFSGGGTKSFSELLKSGGDGTAAPASSASDKEANKKPVSVFANLPTLPPKPATSSATNNRASDWSSWEQEHGSDEDNDGPPEDDVADFLSDNLSEEDEEDADDADETLQVGEDEESAGVQPIRLVSSPPPPPAREEIGTKPSETTTPPGSPSKEPATSAPTAPLASAFGAGPSRPSTKPIRSSPLTGAPISGDEREDDDDDNDDLEEVTITTPPAPQKPSIPVTAAYSAATPGGNTPAENTPAEKGATSRPKTPPPLSAFATPAPKLPPFSLQPSKPATTKSIFGMPNTSATSAAGSSPTSSPSFGSPVPAGDKSATPPSLFGSPSLATSTPIIAQGGSFGSWSAATSPTPTTSTSAALPPQTATAAATGLLGQKPSTPPEKASAGPSFASPAGQPAATAPTEVSPKDAFSQMPEGLEKECMRLMMFCRLELQASHTFATQAHAKRLELTKTHGFPGTRDDLKDVEKFRIADVTEFGRALLTLEKDIAALKDSRAADLKSIAELESAMLRATMRKEEIVRFSKASTDAEFAKMLKARTLSPDHLEAQLQLRRSIRVITDRLQKLEDHLQASKKRITQMKTGKPSIRAPSLDTLNRAYRNIEVAISQQADDVSHLTSRVAKLDMQASRSPARPSLIKRSPDAGALVPAERAAEVAPNVAARTAAALNAERAAQRLKAALLSRKRPLLNTSVFNGPPPINAYTEPEPEPHPASVKQEWTPPPASFFLSPPGAPTLSAPAWNATSPPPSQPLGALPETPKWSLPPFQLPESPESPSNQYSGGSPSPSLRQRSGMSKMHQKPVPLKRSTGTPSSVPPNFSWGPLPGVGPMATLSANVSQKEEKKESEPSLSDSWVADGFGKK